MRRQFPRGAIVVLIVLLAVLAGRPYLDTLLSAATSSRPIAPRSDLGEAERATIGLFQPVSPSVVQVVGAANGSAPGYADSEDGSEHSGTGFVLDGAGHVVTNNHVVSGTREIASRFATGVVGASIVGTAPNYDLAVVKVQNPRILPSPIAVGTSADLNVGQAAFATATRSASISH
jgi:2-alkenal reductase